ncbi:hypothetical protein [uncultured Victivallis sp.]|nr:hypothetical protein [uncultured Victivallis sp.]
MKASPEELLFDDQVFLRQVAAGMRGTLTVLGRPVPPIWPGCATSWLF